MEPDFDVIVIGGGLAGCAAATRLAKGGMNTLLIERAEDAGSKNISGGVLWGNDLDTLLPRWREEAPLQRSIEEKRIAFLTHDSSFSMGLKSVWESPCGYSVLRVKFDNWLSRKAEEAGATLVTGIPVRNLATENGKVCGVIESGEVTSAKAVVLADGANSRITMDSGLRGPLSLHHVGVGIKEVISLPKEKIEDRFGLTGSKGFSSEFVLGFIDGVKAGGFLYTNIDSVSLGVVVNLESLKGKNVYSHDIIELFKEHPSIAPLVEGGRLVEYSAHLVPEGGIHMMPPLFGDGYLVCGDAAGLCFSNGLVLQGMNYAIASGIMAAETLLEAKERNDYSRRTLSVYRDRLEGSYVLSDFKRFSDVGKVTWNPRMYTHYPQFLEATFRDIMKEDGRPKKKMRTILNDSRKKVGLGLFDLLRDAISGGLRL